MRTSPKASSLLFKEGLVMLTIPGSLLGLLSFCSAWWASCFQVPDRYAKRATGKCIFLRVKKKLLSLQRKGKDSRMEKHHCSECDSPFQDVVNISRAPSMQTLTLSTFGPPFSGRRSGSEVLGLQAGRETRKQLLRISFGEREGLWAGPTQKAFRAASSPAPLP